MRLLKLSRSPRKAAAVVALVVAMAVSALFSAVTAGNYSAVVESRILTEVSLDVSVVPGYDGSNLSTISLEVNLQVHNPGHKAMRINTVGYRGWLRDLPSEAGMGGNRVRDDGIVRTENGTRMLFYPVFTMSVGSNEEIGPGETRSVTVILKAFDRNDSEETFSAVEEMLVVSGAAPLWLHYCQVSLVVVGVPRDYEGLDTSYLSEMAVTHRYLGVSLDSGSAGLTGGS